MIVIYYNEPIKSKIIIHSKRVWGQPKLLKPKELKGIKQSFSVDWIPKKCVCKCFILNNDFYIQHRDFGSINIHNHNHEFRRKFIYNDTFGCVVLRGEAWIKIENFIIDIRNNIFPPKLFENLAEQISGEIGDCEWERFFEKIITQTKKLENI